MRGRVALTRVQAPLGAIGYYELVSNVMPADVYFGREHAALTQRAEIK